MRGWTKLKGIERTFEQYERRKIGPFYIEVGIDFSQNPLNKSTFDNMLLILFWVVQFIRSLTPFCGGAYEVVSSLFVPS